MSQFTENVSIRPIPKSSRWITTKDIVWYRFYDNISNRGIDPIVIPEWYEFDWASTPTNLFVILAIIAIFITPWLAPFAIIGYYMQRTEPNTITAAVLHDFIYTDRPEWIWLAEADAIFLEALIACGTNKFKAFAMWAGVSMWGWFYRYKIKKKIKWLFKKK